jgi:hypothetical protein
LLNIHFFWSFIPHSYKIAILLMFPSSPWHLNELERWTTIDSMPGRLGTCAVWIVSCTMRNKFKHSSIKKTTTEQHGGGGEHHALINHFGSQLFMQGNNQQKLAVRGLEELRVNLLLKENSYVSYIDNTSSVPLHQLWGWLWHGKGIV